MAETQRGGPDEGGLQPVKRTRKRPPWQDGEAGTADSFGTWLRRQREVREIDLREIADRTKISIRYLKAMEQDRFDVLPGPIFVRGFLREYAKYVGLSPDEVVNFYLSAHGEEVEEEELPAEAEARPSRSWSSAALLGAVGVLLLAAIAFLFYRAEHDRVRTTEMSPPPPIAAPTPAPVPATPASVPPGAKPEAQADPAPLRVTLDFSQSCWVEAVVDGKRRIAEQYAQGESLQISAQESVVFTTLGNAGGVNVEVNGEPYDLGGSPGQVIHDVRIDLETAGSRGVEGT